MLTGPEKVLLIDSIVLRSFPDQFESLVRDRLQRNPARYTDSTDFRDVVTATVDKVNGEEEMQKFLAVILYIFKAKSDLGRLAADLLYRHWGAAGLQTYVQGSDMYEWSINADAMKAIAGQVCMLEVRGKGSGTGVLVSEDRVLTAFHVIEPLMNGTGQADDSAKQLKCRFDFATVKAANGAFETRTGVSVAVADQWLLAHSQQTTIEREQQVCPPDNQPVADFDYALIQLADKVGATRGWAHLKTPALKAAPFEIVKIAQHPQDQPLKGADGRFTTFPTHGARLQYSASTSGATSGAPCWNEEFDLVAIHNLGGISMPNGTIENQGIPIERILDDLKLKRNGEIPPPPPPPLATTTKRSRRIWSVGADYPVLGREELQRRLDELLDSDTNTQLLLVRGEHPGGTFSIDVAERIFPQLGHVVVKRTALTLTQTGPAEFVADLAETLKLGPIKSRTGADMSTAASLADRHLVDEFLPALRAKFPVDRDAPAQSTLVCLFIDALDQAKLTDETHDFLIALLGKMSSVPTLRVGLIGYNRELPGSIARIALEDETPAIAEREIEEHLQHTCDIAEYGMAIDRIKDLAREVVTKSESDADQKTQALPAGTAEEIRAKARATANYRLELIGLKVQKITRSIKSRKPADQIGG